MGLKTKQNKTNLCAQLCPTFLDPMDYIASWAPASMGFPRQEYWSGLPFPSPGDLPHPGIKPRWQADSLLTVPLKKFTDFIIKTCVCICVY